MSMLATTVYRHVAIPPGEGEPFSFGNVGGQFKIGGGATDERFAVAQLPEIPPFTLAAPLHRHHEEDEYTYVVAGRLGAIAGGEVMIAEAGTGLVKPRGEWHTFWNPGDEPCNLIEIVSPAGFESYFQKVADSWGRPRPPRADQRGVFDRHGFRQRPQAVRAVRTGVPGDGRVMLWRRTRNSRTARTTLPCTPSRAARSVRQRRKP